MASAAASQPPKFETRRGARPGRWGRIALIVTVVVLLLLAVAVALCRRSFSEAAILEDLHEVSDSQVTARSYHQKLFPYPGCMLEGVVFAHGSHQIKPLITIERLTIRGSYLGLLQTRVKRITAEGMQIFIPAFGTGEAFHTTPSTISVDEIVANGSGVEFAFHEPDKRPLRFDVHEALLRNVVPNRPFDYRLKVHNPEPPGEVAVEGKFGALEERRCGRNPHLRRLHI
jgi:hypothetical protein